MARAKDTNARVTRWFLALQDFHFVCVIGLEPRTPMLMASLGSGQLSQVCQGSLPTHPLFFPYCLMLPTGPGRRLGGGSVTSVPKLHQRRPGNKQGTPARPHHRLIGHSCSSSRGGYISHASPTTSETLLHETEHLLALSFPFHR